MGISGIGLGDDLLTLLHEPSAWQGIPWGQWWQRGELWMLLAALSMAVGTILMRPLTRYADPVVATGWHMVLGGLPLLLWPSLNTPAPWATLHWADVLNLAMRPSLAVHCPTVSFSILLPRETSPVSVP